MEVPHCWRLKNDLLHIVVEQDGKIFLRGRECVWDGTQLQFADEKVYAPDPTEVSNMLAVGVMGMSEEVKSE